MTATTATTPRMGGSARRWLAGGLAVLFGLATIVQGGHTLFGGPAAGTQHIVPFVLVFNVSAGFAYVLAGLATLAGRGWAVWLARGLAVTTVVVFVAFGVHVVQGGAFEPRTALAMTLRSGFWIAQALVLPRLLWPRPVEGAHA